MMCNFEFIFKTGWTICRSCFNSVNSMCLWKNLFAPSLSVRYFSLQGNSLLMRRKDYIFPELKDEDLDEEFVRGSGPGGQSVNKTSNCVVLKHKPTGIVVKCHETRSLPENRKIARRRLEEKIDYHLHGNNSFISQQWTETKDYKTEKKRKAKERLERKKAFKEREILDKSE